jgi:hypothetical protein
MVSAVAVKYVAMRTEYGLHFTVTPKYERQLMAVTQLRFGAAFGRFLTIISQLLALYCTVAVLLFIHPKVQSVSIQTFTPSSKPRHQEDTVVNSRQLFRPFACFVFHIIPLNGFR